MPELEAGRRDDSAPKLSGSLFVISGPSGVGKDAVLSKIRLLDRPYHFVITATTRSKRPGERDGVDYFFLDRKSFERMIEDDQLLEWAEVYGNLYGVPKRQVTEAQGRGLDVIIKTDVQGAATIKRMMPEATLIFLQPPSAETLDRRLRKRNTESQIELNLKLETARSEIQESRWFDHIITNHDGGIGEAAASIDHVIQSRRV